MRETSHSVLSRTFSADPRFNCSPSASPSAFLSLGFAAPGVPGVPGVIGVILDLSDLPISQSLLSERRELVCHLDRIDSLCLIDAQAQSSLTSNYQEILNYCGR
jgi:hypothetical protein